MANTFNPDPLNSGGKRWDVLAKNSSQDGDYSWQSLDPKYPETQQQAYEKQFAWQAKDYVLLAMWDPKNSMKLDTDNRAGYRLGNGTGDGHNMHQLEFNFIPQTYRTLVLKGEFYGERGSYPNWVSMRFNNYGSSNNAGQYSRWHYGASTQNVDNTDRYYISRYYQPDSYNPGYTEIHIPGYSREQNTHYWMGWRIQEELGYQAMGFGYNNVNEGDSNRNTRPIHRIWLQAESGFFHPQSWVALYGIK
jgi:hypothetical protein